MYKIEVKKHTEQSNLEQNRNEEKRQSHRRSTRTFKIRRKKTEQSSIDRDIGADRSAKPYEDS